MPANINEDNIAYVGEKPWHGIGTEVPDDLAPEQMLQAAGLDWTVSTMPVYADYDKQDDDGARIKKSLECPDNQAVCRDDNHDVLGVVGSRYEPIQNDKLFDFVSDIVEEGHMRFETAGALGKGERVWTLLSGDVFEVDDGDRIENYLLVTSSHDGSSRFTAYPTPIRVVCQNTMNISLSRVEQSITFEVMHTESAEEKIDAAGEVLSDAVEYFGELETVFNQFLTAEYTDEDFDTLLRHVLYPLDDDQDERSGVIKNRMEDIEDLYRANDHEGTAWGAFNAVSEYADHHKTFRESKNYSQTENRMRSVMWGSAKRMKDAGFKGIANQVGVEV